MISSADFTAQGAVLALALHQRNISAAIFECRPESYVHGGNVALAPNALRVLDHLGAYEALHASGFSYDEILFANASGAELGRFRNGSREQYNFQALRIHRAAVRDELLRRVRKAGIPLHWNKKCIEVVSETAATQDDEGSATVKFEDGETVTARFVVAADGIHSGIRSFIAPRAEKPVFSGQMGLGATLSVDQLGNLGSQENIHLPCMLFGANGSFAIMPASFDGQNIGFFTTFNSKDIGHKAFTELSENKVELQNMLAERFLKGNHQWPELVKQMCEKSPSSELWLWP